MISKRKRNTILAYCMASVIMLCVLASNISKVTTSLKTNTKKIVAENNYVETSEISYGLVAIEASSCIEENKDIQNVTEKTEKKKEESKESTKTSENKSESSTSNKNKTAQSTSNKVSKNSSSNKSTTVKSNSNKTKSNTTKTTTSNKKTSNKTTSNKTTSNKTVSNKTTSNKTVSNKTTSNKTTSNKTTGTTNTSNNSSLGKQIVNYAKQFNGNPYVYGGTSLTKGADCSGFVQSVYKHFGINLPRTATPQSKVGKYVSFNDLQPGDLVFYGNGSSTKVAHVAIYIGNGKIIHAQNPKDGIGITTMHIMTKVTARRVI